MFSQPSEIDVCGNALLRFDGGRDRLFESIDGTLWITAGDERDVVVEQGDSIRLDGDNVVLIGSIGGHARVRISEFAPELARAA